VGLTIQVEAPTKDGHYDLVCQSELPFRFSRSGARLLNILTFIESGVKDFTAQSYIGILAPTGTPALIIGQLQKASADGLASGPAPHKLRAMGSEIATAEQRTPGGFAKFIRTDYEKMREAAKLAGITPQ